MNPVPRSAFWPRMGLPLFAQGLVVGSLLLLLDGGLLRGSPAALPATLPQPPSAPLAAGTATIFDDTREAFGLPAPELLASHRAAFFVGNSYFNENWIAAPASVGSRDGLGPLFNARSCSSCHFKDGRSRPPDPGEPLRTMLLRISLPGRGEHGQPRPHPVYGDQIQGMALPGVAVEAEVHVDYSETPGLFGDGEPYTLRRPRYRLKALGYGPLPPGLLLSARVAPPMIGLGLLEAVPEAALQALEDPSDRDGDGISGRLNQVWDHRHHAFSPGRFGWKAEQPSVEQQSAAAFLGDMGLTTSLFRQANHSPHQKVCLGQPSGGTPEVSDDILRQVVLYARTLGVPARRRVAEAPVQRGELLFAKLGCARCHVTTLFTGASPELPELSQQPIQPYTDLLLHDMGEGLADGRPTFAADGREWRTPPLWGIGLVAKVNGHQFFLHDGRARGFAEAVLWHAGEATSSRDAFIELPGDDRQALVAFLESL